MKIVYNLEDNNSSRSRMGESFLFGNFERQHSMLKKATLPVDVRCVFDVDMVIIHFEAGDARDVNVMVDRSTCSSVHQQVYRSFAFTLNLLFKFVVFFRNVGSRALYNQQFQ